MNLGQAALHTIEQTVEHAVEHARHLLPIQGPIGVFVHHNTLHAFQHLPFDDAVEIGARTFNAEPWLPEQTLRHAYLRGRIRDQDIDDVTTTLDDTPLPGLPWSQRSLRRALLRGGAVAIAPAEARFLVDERHATSHLRHDLEREARAALLEEGDEHYVATSLWRAVTHLVTSTPHAVDNTPARPRDGVLALTGTDIDVDIDALFMRLAVAFLDQGVSLWPMPHRERGLLHAARDLITAPTFIAPPCLVGLAQRLVAHDDALALLTNSLNDLGVDDDSITDIVAREALALPGVFGMLSRLEHDPHLLPHVPVPASLIEALALRFCMVATAVANTLPKTSTSWRDGIAPTDDDESHTLATSLHVVFALQGLGVSAGRLRALGDEASAVLVREIAAFDELSRRRLLHAAFERRHTHQVLEPLAQHTHTRMTTTTKRPRMQLICCIDEREESLRRAVEELSPDVETFGAAGFFGIAIAYRGLDDGKAQARCPVVVTPWHAIREAPRPEQEHLGRRRALERKAIAAVRRNLLLGSRAMVRGFITTAALGVLSLVPASSRLLFPRAVARLRARVTELFLASPETRLELAHDHIADDHGFSQDEQADVVAGLLLPMALVKEFARLVVVLGHGATSQNNPHDSAYQCGACGGLPGGPNARLFCMFANDTAIRVRLAERGIDIPPDTWFIAGQHDTTNDDVTLLDDRAIPTTHTADVHALQALLRTATAQNALERTRRFELGPLSETPEAAKSHVEARAEHLAEPRAEYGHSSNAVAVFGTRSLTRGLFLDRRAFLVSYDPHNDNDDALLAKLLAAAGPVCAGINLEYWFSTVDNERYGCGTKLPHNIAGLVGVMNGASSDLRTGLTQQMVEIHEPVRLLLICETTPERLAHALLGAPLVKELVDHGWVRTATVDPDSGVVKERTVNGFVEIDGKAATAVPLATTPSSLSWALHNGGHKRGHLPIARIAPEHTA